MKHLSHLAVVAPIGVCCTVALADLPPIPAGAISAGAQVVNRYGSEYVLIPGGNPGYRGADQAANPFYIPGSFEGRGVVSYGYGIARTETTVAEWAEFVNAYSPYWGGDPESPTLTTLYIGRDQNGRYSYNDRVARVPATSMSWLVAATYCNWLTNGKRLERAAFESGAYDLRGIDISSPNPPTAAITQNASAAFRLPTVDEWYKAGYFDPNRNGTGLAGWWLFPNRSASPPVSGLPESGGETNAGIATQMTDPLLGVASYGGQSPWGLFDVSGGAREFTCTSQGLFPGQEGEYMFVCGTSTFNSLLDLYVDEQVAFGRFAVRVDDSFGSRGIRIVTAVPSGSGLVPIAALALLSRRSRK